MSATVVPVPPPSKHQLALMIWLAVFPTLVLLNLALREPLAGLPVVARTFVLVTIAVPIVIYGLMPQLHRLRVRLLTRHARSSRQYMSRRMIAVTVGVLFVVQMVTAMAGTSMIQAFADRGGEGTPPTLGVLLMMCSGFAVVGIGLLMYGVLKAVDRRLAFWYPALRIVECVVSAACGIYLLTQLHEFPNHLLWVYIPTGIGGLVLNYLLFVSRLVPRPIAVLGLVGYTLLTLGVPLDLLGVLDLNTGTGMALLVPGGLFEALVLPIWLIAKGFRAPLLGEMDRPLSPARVEATR